MPIDLTRSSTFDEHGIALSDDTGNIIAYIFASPDDPTVVGIDAPLGSLFLRSGTGTMYVKTGVVDTNWSRSVPEMDQRNILAFAARHG